VRPALIPPAYPGVSRQKPPFGTFTNQGQSNQIKVEKNKKNPPRLECRANFVLFAGGKDV
jgi:hypothetical protein